MKHLDKKLSIKPRIEILSTREQEEIEALLTLWQSSVEATHSFLSKCDIVQIRPEVRKGLEQVQTLICLRVGEGHFAGFLGLEGSKIEMLFIAPECRSRGYGKLLFSFAREKYGIIYVDVNEQNIHAVNFYTHLGFTLYKRTEVDQVGRPFPLLYLEIKK